MHKFRNVLSIVLVILFLLLLLFLVVLNFDNKSIVGSTISIVLVVAFCSFILYKIFTRKSRMWRPDTLQAGEKVLFEQENTELISSSNGSYGEQTKVTYLLRVTNLRLFFLGKDGEAIHSTVVFTENPSNTLWKIFKDGVVEAKRANLSTDEYSNVRLKFSIMGGNESLLEFKVREKTNLELLKSLAN